MYPQIINPKSYSRHGVVTPVQPYQACCAAKRPGAPALFATDWLIGAYVALYVHKFQSEDTKRTVLTILREELVKRGVKFTETEEGG